MIRLRYIEIDRNLMTKQIVSEALQDRNEITEIKWRVLERLGIKRDGEASPLYAWLKTMCRENGLPETIPVPQELTDAILNDPNAYRFVWWLA